MSLVDRFDDYYKSLLTGFQENAPCTYCAYRNLPYYLTIHQDEDLTKLVTNVGYVAWFILVMGACAQLGGPACLLLPIVPPLFDVVGICTGTTAKCKEAVKNFYQFLDTCNEEMKAFLPVTYIAYRSLFPSKEMDLLDLSFKVSYVVLSGVVMAEIAQCCALFLLIPYIPLAVDGFLHLKNHLSPIDSSSPPKSKVPSMASFSAAFASLSAFFMAYHYSEVIVAALPLII